MSKVSEFTVQDMLPLGLTFVVVAIALAYGASVLTDTGDEFTGYLRCGTNSTGGSSGTILYSNCSYDYNITVFGNQGLNDFGSKLPLIATIVVAAVIIGILVRYLAVRVS